MQPTFLHQTINIAQAEGGGNGESPSVVNRKLPACGPVRPRELAGVNGIFRYGRAALVMAALERIARFKKYTFRFEKCFVFIRLGVDVADSGELRRMTLSGSPF